MIVFSWTIPIQFFPKSGMISPIVRECWSGDWIMRCGRILMGVCLFWIFATHHIFVQHFISISYPDWDVCIIWWWLGGHRRGDWDKVELLKSDSNKGYILDLDWVGWGFLRCRWWCVERCYGVDCALCRFRVWRAVTDLRAWGVGLWGRVRVWAVGAHKYSTDLCEDGVCVCVMPWIQLVVPVL